MTDEKEAPQQDMAVSGHGGRETGQRGGRDAR